MERGKGDIPETETQLITQLNVRLAHHELGEHWDAVLGGEQRTDAWAPIRIMEAEAVCAHRVLSSILHTIHNYDPSDTALSIFTKTRIIRPAKPQDTDLSIPQQQSKSMDCREDLLRRATQPGEASVHHHVDRLFLCLKLAHTAETQLAVVITLQDGTFRDKQTSRALDSS